MKVLNWICFILVCLDTLSYILEQADKINNTSELSSRVAKFMGLLTGIAARVYVLYNAAAYWLFA